MTNPLHLVAGTRYKVIKSFTDYDKRLHPTGEEWVFIRTNFLPYDDGLTLHVQLCGLATETVYRLQWRPEEQAAIIEHFTDFVSPV